MSDYLEELRGIWEIIASKFPSQYTTFFIFFLLVLAVLAILLFKSKLKDFSKNHQEGLAMLFLGVLLGSTLFYVVFSFGLVDSDAGKTEIVQKNSLHVACNYDFEDIKDPTYEDWVPGPTGKNHSWDPSDKYAHSGTHSLELSVKIQPHEKNPLIEYGSIGISDLNIHKAKTIEAWALVPKSDQARGSNIMSHFIVYYKNSSGKYITIYSEAEKLKPGVWTQMFLGVCYIINSTNNCTCEWDGKIDELYLTVWSDQSYWGPIYFDDITIWK